MSHIFDAVTVVIGRTDQMACVLQKILVTHIGVYDWEAHFVALGRDGFAPGLERWYRSFFLDLFDCDEMTARKELGILDVKLELQNMSQSIAQLASTDQRVLCSHEVLLHLYGTEFADTRCRLRRIEQSLGNVWPGAKTYPLACSVSPDVSWHSFNSNSVYEMSGGIRPPTPQLDVNRSPLADLIEENSTVTKQSSVSSWKRLYCKVRSLCKRKRTR